MATQLTLYNNALLILGERALQSLSEARESRRLLDTVWSRPAIDRCLQQGQWQFAMRAVQIYQSPSLASNFGYRYGFDRPVDLIRSCAVCQDEYFKVPLLQYMVEGSYWYADIDPIYVRYVSNDAAFGGDLTIWPANFAAYVEAYLAEAIVTRMTQDDNEWKRVRAVLSRALSEAKSSDAMEQATKFAPTGSWVRSRYGNSGGDRGNTGSLIG
jgi:hypothetical protein